MATQQNISGPKHFTDFLKNLQLDNIETSLKQLTSNTEALKKVLQLIQKSSESNPEAFVDLITEIQETVELSSEMKKQIPIPTPLPKPKAINNNNNNNYTMKYLPKSNNKSNNKTLKNK